MPTDAEIIAAYCGQEGTLQSVAVRFGVTVPAVRKAIAGRGLPFHRRGRKPGMHGKLARNQAIVASLASDPPVSIGEIARRFSLSRQRVSQIAKRAGVRPAFAEQRFAENMAKNRLKRRRDHRQAQAADGA